MVSPVGHISLRVLSPSQGQNDAVSPVSQNEKFRATMGARLITEPPRIPATVNGAVGTDREVSSVGVAQVVFQDGVEVEVEIGVEVVEVLFKAAVVEVSLRPTVRVAGMTTVVVKL